MTTRDYAAEVDSAMRQCRRCHRLDDNAREAHRQRVFVEILHTQTRTLEPLPDHAWPQGRPHKENA